MWMGADPAHQCPGTPARRPGPGVRPLLADTAQEPKLCGTGRDASPDTSTGARRRGRAAGGAVSVETAPALASPGCHPYQPVRGGVRPVREASGALTVHWKERLGRNDVTDTSFWQQILSAGVPDPGRPNLAWPGPAEDQTAKSMRGGLASLAAALNNLATGLKLAVRNVATRTRDELTEQEGMERLAAYSYFARLLDQCEIRRAKERKTRESFPSAEPVRRASRCLIAPPPKALGMAMTPAELEVRKDTLELLDNGDPAGGSPRPSAGVMSKGVPRNRSACHTQRCRAGTWR
ncbi:TIGR02391 family protein [Streptomyces sp. NPDC050856]|uniref:TIGR02391 family protein n=1 Tax=Streptomyces sp. NPDC050856 TaxID=3154939 RepID=UPI0033DA3417